MSMHTAARSNWVYSCVGNLMGSVECHLCSTIVELGIGFKVHKKNNGFKVFSVS